MSASAGAKGTGLGDGKVNSIIDKARNVLSGFTPSVENLAKIIKSREAGKLDEVFDFINLYHACFIDVIGEGLPVKCVYHEWCGMTNFILDVYCSIRSSKSEDQAATARHIVEVYEKHMGLLRSKSPFMLAVLKPIENAHPDQGVWRELTQDELQLLMGHYRIRSEKYRTVCDYMGIVEPNYGGEFRRLVLCSMTSEELESYRLEMTDALESFISAD